MPPVSGAAQLFVDRDYGGASATLTAGSYNSQKLSVPDSVGNDTPYVGDAFNDQISSVQVTATG